MIWHVLTVLWIVFVVSGLATVALHPIPKGRPAPKRTPPAPAEAEAERAPWPQVPLITDRKAPTSRERAR